MSLLPAHVELCYCPREEEEGAGGGGLKICEYSVDAVFYVFGQVVYSYKGQIAHYCAQAPARWADRKCKEVS